jgi:PST family polysaccharide transporter
VASLILAAATGLFGLPVVLVKIGPGGRFASRIARLYALIGWPIPETQ